MIDQILQGLLASGPLAGLLGYAVYVLWKENKSKEARIEKLHADQRKFFAQLANMDVGEEEDLEDGDV